MTTQDSGTLPERIGVCLKARATTLACVEIGSGGSVSSSLTAEPGSSAYFSGALLLTTNPRFWPQSITGDGDWQAKPPGSRSRLHTLAGVARTAFAADWVLAVECVPAAGQHVAYIAILSPAGIATFTTASHPTEALLSGREPLVQCVLGTLAERLEERCEDPP